MKGVNAMGYYTKYSLDIKYNNIKESDIITHLKGDCDEAGWALTEFGETEDSTKWYDHENDFKEFSKKYPTLLFILNGVGEEYGDTWIKYFQNGKMQECKAKITFDEFDLEKLR